MLFPPQGRALRSGDLPPTVAKSVDRLSASLQSNKRFGLQVELSGFAVQFAER